jgi:trimeric autotransporter adhesin
LAQKNNKKELNREESMNRYLFGGLVVVILAGAVTGFGQSVQGGIRGAVMDPGGAIIPGVEVTLLNMETNATRAAVSNEQGQYVFAALTPGLYRIKAALPGFKTYERQGIRVGTQEVPIIDITLEVGAVSDEVSVVAEAPLLETSNASNGQLLSAAVLDLLPNPGRNAFMMAQTVPTVVPAGDPTWNRQQDQNGSSAISLAGGPVRGNNYTIDGISVTDVRNRAILSPSIESISEVKIQVNTFDAEMGRTGGGVFNTAAKSGANQWHGSGLVQNRPTWAVANNWFSNARSIPLNKDFKYWLAGGSIGGPIRKDKTFFWFSTEDYKDNSTVTSSRTVPTLKQRQGDFSETVDANGRPVVVYDPSTTRLNPNFNSTRAVSLSNPQYIRDAFPGNKIPANRFDPIALALMKYWPEPDARKPSDPIDNTLNYSRAATLPNTGRQFTIKMDHQLTEHLSISGFAGYQNTHEQTNGVYFRGDQEIADSSNAVLQRVAKVFAFNGTWTRSSQEVVTFRYGYSRFDDYSVPHSLGYDIKQLGFSDNFLKQVTVKKFPSVSVSGYQGFGDTSLSTLYYYAQNANVGVSRFMGRHSLKYGFDFRHVGAFYWPQGQGSGTFNFTTGFTQLDPQISAATSDPNVTGNGFASFLLGASSTVTMTNANPLDGYFRYYAGYLQDDFRLNNKLTFNIGLRYEYEGAMREKQDRIVVGFDRNAKNPIGDAVIRNSLIPGNQTINQYLGRTLMGGLMYAGVNGNRTSQADNTKTKLGPRIGVAWNAPHNFVVRGGYGVFYAPEQYTSPSSTVWATQGYTITDTATNASGTGTASLFPRQGFLSDPYPSGVRQPVGNAPGLGAQLGDTASFVDDSGKAGRVQQYTIDIQKEMPGAVVVSVGYVGSWTSNVTIGGTGSQSVNLNQIRPGTVLLTSALVAQVPNPFQGQSGVAGTRGTGSTIQAGELLRPFPQFTTVTMQRVHQGFARYNSMVVKAEKRSANGLTIRGNWTWSKNLDNVIGEDNFYVSESSSAQDAYDLNKEYAYSTIDTPHRVNITPIYQLPFGKDRPFMNGGGWTDKVFGGWALSLVGSFQTGFPLTISQTTDTTTMFEGSQRPVRILGVDPGTPGRIQDRLGAGLSPANAELGLVSNVYLNKNAFMSVTDFNNLNKFDLTTSPYPFGNMARNIADIRTPGAKLVNMSLGKTTSITEGVRLTFRVEASNALNTPRFSGPNTSITAAQFGQITSQTGFQRQVQWLARVHF